MLLKASELDSIWNLGYYKARLKFPIATSAVYLFETNKTIFETNTIIFIEVGNGFIKYQEREERSKPAHSWASVRWVTASRFVAMKRHPGFSRMQSVPYLHHGKNKKKIVIIDMKQNQKNLSLDLDHLCLG